MQVEHPEAIFFPVMPMVSLASVQNSWTLPMLPWCKSQMDRQMQHSPRLDSQAGFQRCLQHSPELVTNSEPCPPLLCPRRAVSKLLSCHLLQASAARSESAGTRAVAPSPGSLHAKAPSASSPAQRQLGPGRWHRAMTNTAGSIP